MYELLINDTPVKIWARTVEPSAYKQIMNLSTLPFVFHHLAFFLKNQCIFHIIEKLFFSKDVIDPGCRV